MDDKAVTILVMIGMPRDAQMRREASFLRAVLSVAEGARHNRRGGAGSTAAIMAAREGWISSSPNIKEPTAAVQTSADLCEELASKHQEVQPELIRMIFGHWRDGLQRHTLEQPDGPFDGMDRLSRTGLSDTFSPAGKSCAGDASTLHLNHTPRCPPPKDDTADGAEMTPRRVIATPHPQPDHCRMAVAFSAGPRSERTGQDGKMRRVGPVSGRDGDLWAASGSGACGRGPWCRPSRM